MEHPQKIETAFVNVLAAQAWPATFDTARILPGESDSQKTGQCVLCICEDSDQEDPPSTGDKWNTVRVELRTPALRDQSATIAKHRSAAAVLENTVLDTTLKDLLTAAIADFTVIGILDRLPIRDQNDNYWMSGYTLRVLSCSSDVT